MGYVGGLAYGYHYLGIGDIVPMYLYTIVSVVLLVVSFFKAGSVLFSMKSYDILISLPVNKSAILVSRFFTMYVTNLVFSLLVLVPGLTVHIYFAKPGISFYLISLLVMLFAPLLPLTIASILGAGIKAISSRMKRRNLVEVLLCMVLVIFPIVFGTKMGEPTENMDPEAIKDMIGTLTGMLGSIFPPALWYHNALQGSFLHLVLLLGIPALIFTLFVWLLSLKFTDICAGLNATYAKQNYKVTTLKSVSALLALLKKEMKLY
jgi:ABC-2 type transport system permease protein